MDFAGLIREYKASPLDMEKLSDYEKFAYGIFHNPEIVKNPNLEITTRLDITGAKKISEKV